MIIRDLNYFKIYHKDIFPIVLSTSVQDAAETIAMICNNRNHFSVANTVTSYIQTTPHN